MIGGRRKGALAALARGALHALSLAYGAYMRRRNRRWDAPDAAQSAGVPVISVGNITVGGTGKTVLVEDIARRLAASGHRPAIVSRGYTRERAGGENDEFRVLAENLPHVPHVTGADRLAAARQARERFAADVIVLDDAFSHRRIARDLDIVTIDALCPFGYGYLLPRGLLREPPSALARAGLVVVTRADLATDAERDRLLADIRSLAPNAALVTARHEVTGLVDVRSGEQEDAATIKTKRAYVFCAIGNPLAFEHTAAGVCREIVGSCAFDDHHVFGPDELARVERLARQSGADCLLVTQKDRVKLHRTGYNWDTPVHSVEVRMGYLTGASTLDRLVSRAVTAR